TAECQIAGGEVKMRYSLPSSYWTNHAGKCGLPNYPECTPFLASVNGIIPTGLWISNRRLRGGGSADLGCLGDSWGAAHRRSGSDRFGPLTLSRSPKRRRHSSSAPRCGPGRAIVE